MNDAAVKAFVALIPVCALFTGATIIFAIPAQRNALAQPQTH